MYKVKVNNTIDLDIASENVSETDIIKTSDTKCHVLYNNKSYNTNIIQADFSQKTYKVTVNNNAYNINIFNDLDALIKDMGFSVGAVKHINSINAPMPGLILDINVKVGQPVKENDTLLILEAMKMENSITSPRDGIIKFISATIGDTIDKGQLLIEFE
jgi:biotin carboxyl carrier protein